ncbi:MAG: DUF3047 domain-containing protein [Deltaproteobacteria bacterium]
MNRPLRRSRRIIALATALLLLSAAPAPSEEIAVGRFGAGDLSGWKPKIFKGKTDYRLVEEDGRTVLRAESRKAASGLFKEIRIDPRTAPILRWSWKIERTIANGDGRTREGDDYAARVYVVFPSLLFWRTKAVNYIWANKLPAGQFLPNAYTSNAMMVAVESGNDRAGEWIREERNLVEDYRRLFGKDPPEIGAVAIMTDTDNTGGEAIAWYGDITLGPVR